MNRVRLYLILNTVSFAVIAGIILHSNISSYKYVHNTMELSFLLLIATGLHMVAIIASLTLMWFRFFGWALVASSVSLLSLIPYAVLIIKNSPALNDALFIISCVLFAITPAVLGLGMWYDINKLKKSGKYF